MRWRRVRALDEGGRAPLDAAVEEGAEAVASGELLAHPTATTYGIGAGPRELDDEIARLKGRPPGRPLLRIAGCREDIEAAHPELRWSGRAERLAGAFWPGPLTLVLDDGSPEGLAVRVESHPVTRAVLLAAGTTMSSTSLNRSGEPPALTPERVEATLDAFPESDVGLVWLDAGALPESPASTLVSLRRGAPRLLREGAVSVAEVEARLESDLERDGVSGEGAGP